MINKVVFDQREILNYLKTKTNNGCKCNFDDIIKCEKNYQETLGLVSDREN